VITRKPQHLAGTSYPQHQLTHGAIPAVCALPRRSRSATVRTRSRQSTDAVERGQSFSVTPRQPPHRRVDSRCVSAAGSSPGRTPPPCHTTLPLSSRTRFVPIRTRHSTISPAARLTAAQPQQRMLDTNIVIVFRWIDPAPLPDQIAISAITLARTVHRPAPRCGATTSRTPTTSLPSARAAVRPPQQTENEFDPAPSDAEAAPAPSAASRPRSSPHADSHNDRSPTRSSQPQPPPSGYPIHQQQRRPRRPGHPHPQPALEPP
jgi:hypothetical protein